LQGWVFVAAADAEVEVVSDVSFRVVVVDFIEPERRICEEVLILEVTLPLMMPVLYPNIVVEPSVVVIVEDLLVIVVTMASVEMAEEVVVVASVMVEEYVMYGPVGSVASETPVTPVRMVKSPVTDELVLDVS